MQFSPRSLFLTGSVALATTSLLGAQIGFQSAVSLPAGNQPEAAALFDADGDGDLDLAVTSDAPDKVTIYLNDGAGNFAPGQTVFTGAGSSPNTPAAADFDGDGDWDLAVSLKNTNQLLLVVNTGGTFSTGAAFAVGQEPRRVVAADFTGDGRADVMVSNRNSNNVSFLVNNGAGGFAAAVSFATGQEPRDLVAADLDGDADLDFAVAVHDDRLLAVFFNNGVGGFGAPLSLSVGGQLRPEGIDAADLNGDGAMDLVAGTSGNGLNFVSVFLGTGGGSFGARADYATGGLNPGAVAAADYDLDGDVDVATVNEDSGTLAALANAGNGTFGAASLFAVGTTPHHLAGADLDHNGSVDLVTTNRDSNNVSILRNLATGPVATATVRNGSGTNPLVYANQTLPVLGTVLAATVDTTGHAGATFTVIAGYGGAHAGLSTAFGELLVDPTVPMFTSVVLSGGGLDAHSLSIPDLAILAGVSSYTQAVIFGGSGPELGNAIDYTVGY